MTKLLEEAFARASRLSAEEQEVLGALIIEELEAEAKWDTRLGSSRQLSSVSLMRPSRKIGRVELGSSIHPEVDAAYHPTVSGRIREAP